MLSLENYLFLSSVCATISAAIRNYLTLLNLIQVGNVVLQILSSVIMSLSRYELSHGIEKDFQNNQQREIEGFEKRV